MEGKSVLDIAAFDGLLSFEAERRGADAVLATDVWEEPTVDESHWNSLRPGKAGFDIACDYLDSSVESKRIGIYDITPETVGIFDNVLMPSLIYHLPRLYKAIEHAVQAADEQLIVESAVSHHKTDSPVIQFYQPDPGMWGVENASKWWEPTLNCIENMMMSAGCESTDGFIRQGATQTFHLQQGDIQLVHPFLYTKIQI